MTKNTSKIKICYWFIITILIIALFTSVFNVVLTGKIPRFYRGWIKIL